VDAEKHNKYLAYAHFGYAGFQLLWSLVVVGLMMVIMSAAPDQHGPPPAFFAMVFAVMVVVQLFFTLPSVVAGYALLKRKSWARIAAIIAGATAGMSVPLGTAVCVYTFVFLFSDAGKQLYDADTNRAMRPVASLFGPPEEREAPRAADYAYTPPSEPPNWRD
jgi:hypothetical protein